MWLSSDSELEEASVIRKFRITAADGKTYDTQHYSLPAIIAVGYKVNSERAVQFRKRATGIIEQFTIKAYVMDDERIKVGGSVLTDQYFEEQLQRIRTDGDWESWVIFVLEGVATATGDAEKTSSRLPVWWLQTGDACCNLPKQAQRATGCSKCCQRCRAALLNA